MSAAVLLVGCREAPTRTAPAGAGTTVASAPSVDAASPSPERPAKAGAAPPRSPWSDRQACLDELSQGRKLPKRPGYVRVGSWNIRWFPDGKPGRGASSGGTDLAWLACAIAWLDVDVLSVQEIKTTPHAGQALAEVLSGVDRHGSGRFRAELDRCPNEGAQHVGILYDSTKVTVRQVSMLADLNPHADACKDSLRPGLGAYLAFRGGLDLHLVSVHAKSGVERRSLELRQRSLAGLKPALEALSRVDPDRDVVLAGDFNTMGCRKCSPPVTADEELAAMDRTLATLPVPLRRVGPDVRCSELGSHGPALLDHFVVSASLQELDGGAVSVVSGACGESECGKAGPPAETSSASLSDHCPVLLDFRNRDED